ncbi:MAG: SBBP repeat-containing protein [Candidatus Jettenia sp.]|nr:SBBP repeat-containing protein [Candidatus Jettenia sp.]
MKRAFVIPAVLVSTMFVSKALLADTEDRGKPSKAEISGKIQKLRMPFIRNEGQVDEKVTFYANTFGGTVFVTKDGEIIYSLPNTSGRRGQTGVPLCCKQGSFVRGKTGGGRQESHTGATLINPYLRGYVTRENPEAYTPSLVLGNTVLSLLEIKDAQHEIWAKRVALKEEIVRGRINTIQGEEKSVTEVNYFKGNDPTRWKSDIPTYEIVSLGEVYKGVDLKLKAYGNNVEKLFYISPDTDPGTIQVKLSGANALRVNKEGQLEAETDLGTVTFTRPVAYQEIDGKKVEVAVEYRIQEPEFRSQNTDSLRGNTKPEAQTPQPIYGFKVASYDKARELVIDPLLASTYLGGSGSDSCDFIAISQDGNVYVAGTTGSSDFPTTKGAFDTSYNGGGDDVFVSRLNRDLTKLRAFTYLGGNSSDSAYSLAIGRNKNIYVAGTTWSSDFPTTKGAFDTSYNGGGRNVFVSKLNSDLRKLRASTFLGGGGGASIVMDHDENVYVAGFTWSSDFPTTKGAFDTSYNGEVDVFVSKLNKYLTKLRASTFLGGGEGDDGASIAIDSDKKVYVTGGTVSEDFPITEGAFDTSIGGSGADSVAFVSKLNSDLTKLFASTYLGTTDTQGYSLAIGRDRDVYVTGETWDSDFPTTEGAFDTSLGGDAYDAFVSRFSSDLTKLLASTFLGGDFYDAGYSLAIDRDGNVYVTGDTSSEDFPTTKGAFDTSRNSTDAFVSKFNRDLTKLRASTFLGGGGGDRGISIAIDRDKKVYVTGSTTSSDFPTTEGAFDTSFNGGSDAFISRLDNNLSAP